MSILKNTDLGQKSEYFNADYLKTSGLGLMNVTIRKKISAYSVIKKGENHRRLSSVTRVMKESS